MKFVFDPIYTVKGWFSRLLSAAGWFDTELADSDVAAPAVEGDITVSRGLASSDLVGQVVDVAGSITVTRGLASEAIDAEVIEQEPPVEEPEREGAGGYTRPVRIPQPPKPIPVLVGQFIVTRSRANSEVIGKVNRRNVSGTQVSSRMAAMSSAAAVIDNDEQWIVAVA